MVKPFRNNVGIALFNRDGLVLIARRRANDGPEIIEPGFEWQMPQGGIDEDEDPYHAALRELFEETGVSKIERLGETEWMTYDFPHYQGPSHRLAQFRGQRQKWFALRFVGGDSEINVMGTHNGEEPEFDGWRWERLELLPRLVVPFKRDVYRRVTEAFSIFATRT